jgi:hypothetical protein
MDHQQLCGGNCESAFCTTITEDVVPWMIFDKNHKGFDKRDSQTILRHLAQHGRSSPQQG